MAAPARTFSSLISQKEDHKKPMQGYAYIIEVLVFWRYNPIS